MAAVTFWISAVMWVVASFVLVAIPVISVATTAKVNAGGQEDIDAATKSLQDAIDGLKEKSNPGLILGIVVGVVVLAGAAVVIVLILLKKKKAGGNGPQAPQGPAAPQAPQMPQGYAPQAPQMPPRPQGAPMPPRPPMPPKPPVNK